MNAQQMTLRFPEPSKARTLNHRGSNWRPAWRAARTWRTAVAQHALTLGRSPVTTRHTVLRWRAAGTIPADSATNCARALGVPVASIWPELRQEAAA